MSVPLTNRPTMKGLFTFCSTDDTNTISATKSCTSCFRSFVRKDFVFH